MAERRSSQPRLTPKKVDEKTARTDRLVDEMRKNLIKRKQQQRAMKADMETSLPKGTKADRKG